MFSYYNAKSSQYQSVFIACSTLNGVIYDDKVWCLNTIIALFYQMVCKARAYKHIKVVRIAVLFEINLYGVSHLGS